MEIYDEIVRISERLEPVRRELVPAGGKADTVEGETLRAFDRVAYRWYNDGDAYTDQEPPRVREWEEDEEEAMEYAEMYGDGYTTVRPSVKWLESHGATPEVRKAVERIQMWDHLGETYDELLLELARAVEKIDWSERTPCHSDSRGL